MTIESGTRSRTRRAILSAAASVLARNRAATLAEIADAAEVGRSTLHRYFADRDELVRATIEDSLAAIGQAVEEAALTDGPAREAMRRLIAAMVEAGDRMLFLFSDPRTLEQYEDNTDTCANEPDTDDIAVLALIERGQAEGAFDPAMSPRWIQSQLWGLVYTGCDAANEGILPRHGVTAAVTRAMENGIRP